MKKIKILFVVFFFILFIIISFKLIVLLNEKPTIESTFSKPNNIETLDSKPPLGSDFIKNYKNLIFSFPSKIDTIFGSLINEKPTISMPYNIDTLAFKSFIGSDIIRKFGGINFLPPLDPDTIYGSFFYERLYISVIADSLNISSMIIDTGSGISTFNTNDFRNINFNKFGKEVLLTNIWGNTFPTKELFIDKLVLGKTIYSPNNVPFSSFAGSPNILGTDVLKHFVWKIDNLRRKIYFSQDISAFSYKDCVAVPFELKNGLPFIKFYVNGKVYDAHIDTGYPNFLHVIDKTSINNSLFMFRAEPRDSFICTALHVDKNNSCVGDPFTKKEYRTISDVWIENINFKSEIVEHNIVNYNVLGWDFIQRFEYVILDYINQFMYLGPINDLKSFSYMRNLRTYVNSIGVFYELSEPNIVTVISDSLKEVGLSLGDTIIAIDREPVTVLESLKLFYSKKSATITVKNGNGEIDYTLYRKHNFSEPDTVMTYGEIPLFPLYRNMEIQKNDDGSCGIMKYYNWSPPYIIGDRIRIFD